MIVIKLRTILFNKLIKRERENKKEKRRIRARFVEALCDKLQMLSLNWLWIVQIMMKISEPVRSFLLEYLWLQLENITLVCRFSYCNLTTTVMLPLTSSVKIIKLTLTENTRNKSFDEVAKWMNNRWYFTYNHLIHFTCTHARNNKHKTKKK